VTADMSSARILYRDGGMGDVLMALAAAKAIRHLTGEPVVLVTNAAYVPLAKACPHVDRVFSKSELGAAGHEAISRSRALGRFHDLNPVSFGAAREHQIDAYLWSAGLEAEPALKQLELHLPAESERAAAAKLDAAGVGRDAIVLHPAVSDPNRTWPHERWEALCAELVAFGKPVVLIGAADGNKSARRIAGPGIIDLIGELDLFDTVALLRRADALVTVDGGPLHLAGASDVAIVGLFSVVAGKNRMPFRHGEAGWRSLAIESDCPQFPCYRALNRPEVYTRVMIDARTHGKGVNDVFATWCPNEAHRYACMQQGHQVEHVISALRMLGVLDELNGQTARPPLRPQP
jgi:ADP-heptose:LPS heptosyltransferase